MRTYEALYIVQPNTSDDEVQTVAKGVERLITEGGGAIVRSEIWGKRRLAYEIEKFTDGIFILCRFQTPAAVLEKLQNHFRLHDDIIRNQVIYLDENTLRLEVEQEKRNQAAQARGDRDEDRGGRRGRDDDDDDDDEPRERRPRRRRDEERDEVEV